MISAVDSTTIGRPIEKVFSFVADTTNDPAWHTDFTEVRRRGSEPTQLGTEFDLHIKPFMGQSTGTLKVTRYEPNRLLEFQGRVGAMEPTIRYTFRTADGGTAVGREEALEPPGLMRLFQPFLRPVFARRNRLFLENLKQLLER